MQGEYALFLGVLSSVRCTWSWGSLVDDPLAALLIPYWEPLAAQVSCITRAPVPLSEWMLLAGSLQWRKL